MSSTSNHEAEAPRIGFNQYGNLERARQIATDVIEKYGNLDAHQFKRFREQGIWNDDHGVQSALRALDLVSIEAAASQPVPTIPTHKRGLKDDYDRHPKTDAEFDPRNDPTGQRQVRAIKRLNFAADYADPRAPSGMTLVWRLDLVVTKHELIAAQGFRQSFRDLATNAFAAVAAAKAFNLAINFALDDAGAIDQTFAFLQLWREGAWDELDREFPSWKAACAARGHDPRTANGVGQS